MSKYKILVISSDMAGVGYYRILNPHLLLSMSDDNKEIEFDVRLLQGGIPLLDDNFLKDYNAIIYNRSLNFTPQGESLFRTKLKQHNIKLIYDIDDYWILNNNHLNYKQWKDSGSLEVIEFNLKNADLVITTTEMFAERIRELNNSVVVLPNALNPVEHQWVHNPTERIDDKIRFIWGGGISHIADLRLLKDSFKQISKEKLENGESLVNNMQMILAGYDLRIKVQNGYQMDDPRRSQWCHFESIFSNDFKYIKNINYNKFLFEKVEKNKTEMEYYGRDEKFISEFYQRRWTKPIVIYGTMYNEADVSIAPLLSNSLFNKYKSQLKIIEAGFHHLPIIASNYGPYTIDDIEGKKDGIRKGFLINENENNWIDKIKWYIQNKEAIKDHGEALHEYVMSKYNILDINKKRVEIYKELIENNNFFLKFNEHKTIHNI